MFIRIPLCSLQNLFLLLLLPIQILTKPRKIDLGSSPTPHQNQWNFYSAQRNISGIAAQVPGDIYADLQANGFIEEPLYGQGDRHYRWVGREDWTYERSIELAAEVKNVSFILSITFFIKH
jgi:beta-galactosidase/beta-glucuronidase